MIFEDFQKSVHEHFPTYLPDTSRLFEGVRLESGHERLECLQSIEWPEFSLEVIDLVAGEYWQLSNVWTKYYLPSILLLTSQTELDFNEFGEISDQQDSLMTVTSSYWHDMTWFMTEEWDIQKNVFCRLTSKQVELVEIWLKNIDFKALDKAGELNNNFDYSSEKIEAFMQKMRKFSN